MLSIEDCIALCELTEAEVDAIAEHEHLPEIIAAELGAYLCHAPDGSARIRAMIRDDIRQALAEGDVEHASKLVAVLRHFIETHR
ncbi:MAG: hypothetical protein CMM50_07760 [Rhodospirillaceae bacterium]|nr:hypothetical protein [Rhodospirillaceae bacterium]